MANFYIADLHLGHANVLRYDNRPFADLNEMREAITENWNSVVTGNDTVYILGDFIWAKASEWARYVAPLAGNKVLIRGNHDPKGFDRTSRPYFQNMTNLTEIEDNGRNVVLCHYPIPCFRHDFDKNNWMLYGHVHNTTEYEVMKRLRKEMKEEADKEGYPSGNFINVGCMMPWMIYTPRTLDEIIAGDLACSDWKETVGSIL